MCFAFSSYQWSFNWLWDSVDFKSCSGNYNVFPAVTFDASVQIEKVIIIQHVNKISWSTQWKDLGKSTKWKELLNSLQAEAYSEPYQRFKMQFLAKIVNGFEPGGIFRT